MTALIRVENIEVMPHGKRILSIPRFEISEGEILGVMGPNGAGKSTFLKTVALLAPPDSGSVLYRGEPVLADKSLPVRRKFAACLQQPLLLDTSVFNNIAVGLKLRKKPRTYIIDKVSFWLEKFNISHLAKKHAFHLSGGEAQRVNLARAMVLEPEVLFLDEPFSALDYPTKARLIKDIKTILHQTKTTTVFISHDLMELKYLCDRLAILIDGEIRQSGPTEEVLASPNPASAAFIREWTSLLV
ncbi:energy-coupling factor ABC transporter ATP-binding protein [Bacillus sp. T33-2]|uniref:energy-coupling factor ABC transporter ATP-binding protein n=1 Tax=Bacillus sp. T33-2 TaxID=2054168 RepID=UPI000C77FB21|nr:ABC transporter ATP-binding protein [Bacillus sp. T33-2]PLR92573.1 ABC transporter [Bacillus sp. T33-2]